MIKKISIRILSLTVLLVLLNFVYKAFFYEEDISEHAAIMENIWDLPNDTDIIYVGESSNNNFRKDDEDKRPISDFIGDYYPDLQLSDITKQAGHAGIFRILMANIPKKKQVETVIVTLNLRSFNAQWIYSDLETPLQKSMVLLKPGPPLFNRLMLSFKAYDIKTPEEREAQFKAKWAEDELVFPFDFPYRNVIEWDKAMAVEGIRDSLGNYDAELTPLACHYIKGYAFQIDTLTHPRIRDFNRIIRLADRRGWKLVFNLMAENTERAGELLGDELLYLMDQNRDLLVNYFESRGVRVVDNLHAVPDEEFTDRNWTTEHYGEKGRRIIARNVALALREWYPDDFYSPRAQPSPGN